jgi:hypothetical protein
MVTVDPPADGLRVFDIGPTVFREIADWMRKHKAQVVRRSVQRHENVVVVAYVLDRG